MISDICAPTAVETAVFFLLAVVFGFLVGSGLASFLRSRWASQGIKVGCLAMPITALSAGFLAKLVLPDSNDAQLCGFTPDVIFFPGYAFIIAPFAMLAALFVFLQIGKTR